MERLTSSPVLDKETHYHLLKLLAEKPALTRRQLARELGVGLGKTNYCLKAQINKGWIKAENFRNSNRNLSYFYVLTPKGVRQKARITSNASPA